MKVKARLLTVPRAIANADGIAAVTALANPVTKNFSGWRTVLRGEKVTSTNAVINGAKKMMIPRILDIMSNPSSTTILLLASHNAMPLSRYKKIFQSSVISQSAQAAGYPAQYPHYQP